MQLEVNGQVYFLNFIEEKGRWFVLKATHKGFAAMPVVDDDAAMLFPDEAAVAPSDREIVN